MVSFQKAGYNQMIKSLLLEQIIISLNRKIGQCTLSIHFNQYIETRRERNGGLRENRGLLKN